MSQSTIIHVIPSIIRANVANKTSDPAIVVRQNNVERLAGIVEIRHKGKVVARICPQYDNPIPNGMGEGARVWIETTEDVTLEQEAWPVEHRGQPCNTILA